MMLLLEIVLTLIVIAAIALSFPVRFHFSYSNNGFVWNGKYVYWSFDKGKATTPEEEKTPREKKLKTTKEEKTGKKRKKKPDEGDEFPWFSFLISERSFLFSIVRHLLRALGRLLSIPQWDEFRVHWRIGGEEPEVTGLLSGLCWSVMPFVPSRIQFSFEPDFVERQWGWEASVKVHIFPIMVVAWFLLELIRFPWFRLISWWWRKRHFQPAVSPNFA